VLRTADAMGVQEVHVIDPEGDFAITRKVTRGAHKWLDIVVHSGDRGSADCIEALKARGFVLLGATLSEGAVNLGELELSGKIAFVFGNESDGLTPAMARACDSAYVIPMRGFVQSLNVSVSAAITLQHAITARSWPALDPADAASVLDSWIGKSLNQSQRILDALDVDP
jgi:tRNA (guanosine-2'-O-)-methyltransferase